MVLKPYAIVTYDICGLATLPETGILVSDTGVISTDIAAKAVG